MTICRQFFRAMTCMLVLFLLTLAAADPVFGQASVSISNLNHPANPGLFHDGDQFRIDIVNAAPNAPVTVDNYRDRNLASAGVAPGNTDAAGSFHSMPAFMVSASEGVWSQTWYVGGVPVFPALHFTVSALDSDGIFTPGTPETEYLYNAQQQLDGADAIGLPRFFRFAEVASDPQPAGSVSRQNCSLVHNPLGFDWFNYSDGSAANGAPPLAVPGQYVESAAFSFTSPENGTTGFVFDGEFIGQVTAPTTTPGQAYAEAAYVSDRPCFDGGTEYGWARSPAGADALGNPLDEAVDTVLFYYSTFTNCGVAYLCKYEQAGDAIAQNTNQYRIHLQPNSAGTYRYIFKIFRTNPGSTSYFVLSLTDPYNRLPAKCSVEQLPSTSITALIQTGPVDGTANPDCSEVFIGIDTSWYSAASVSNTGYVSFAQRSNGYYPSTWGFPFPASNAEQQLPPTLSRVIGTVYPNGSRAPEAGLNIISAGILHEPAPRPAVVHGRR